MLYKRYKPPLSTLSSSLSSSTSRLSSSQLLDMRKQLEANFRSLSRYGAKSKWSGDTCRAQLLTLELEPPIKLADQCRTVYVLSSGCRGTCTSYSQVDPRNSTNIVHSCSCCQSLRFVVSIAHLPCRNGHTMRVPFKEAVACSCRPCYVQQPTKEPVTLEELLSKSVLGDKPCLGMEAHFLISHQNTNIWDKIMFNQSN